MKKKALCILLTLIVLLSVTAPAVAATPETVQPYYTYVKSLDADLTISSNGIATCSGGVASTSALSVKAVCELQVYKQGEWKTLKSWSDTGTATADILDKQYTVETGYMYRVLTTGYVYSTSGSTLETATATDVCGYYE